MDVGCRFMCVSTEQDAVAQLAAEATVIAGGTILTPEITRHLRQGVTDSNGCIVSWAELAKNAGGTLSAIGSATIPQGRLLVAGLGNQVGATDHMFTTHGVDIAINPHTGEIKILRYIACQDVGKVLNPEIIRGQILGAIAMGFGQALMEKIFVEGGTVRNQTIHDYLVPTILDVPADPEIILLESGDGYGPHGAKGIGEAGAVAAPAAIAHALYDALGIQSAIPVTPEEIATAAQFALTARSRSAGGDS